MGVTISKLLQPEYILLDIKNTKRTAAIHEVAVQLANHSEVKNFEAFYEELLARERVESTCLGNEVAFPHARTDHVRSMVLAVGRSKEGVWFENAEQTVRLIFVIGTPKKMVTEYLAIVGALARLLKESSIRESLMTAKTPQEFHEMLAAIETRLQAG